MTGFDPFTAFVNFAGEDNWFTVLMMSAFLLIAGRGVMRCYLILLRGKNTDLYTYVGPDSQTRLFYAPSTIRPTDLLWPTDSAAKDDGSPCGYCESTVTGTRCQSCGAPRRGR